MPSLLYRCNLTAKEDSASGGQKGRVGYHLGRVRVLFYYYFFCYFIIILFIITHVFIIYFIIHEEAWNDFLAEAWMIYCAFTLVVTRGN